MFILYDVRDKENVFYISKTGRDSTTVVNF